MKQIAWLFLIVAGSASLLCAEEHSKAMQLTGWVCNSKCVVQSGDQASCSQNCTETSGDAVFVADQGKLYTISEKNQQECKKHMRQHVNMMAETDKDQKELEWVHFLNQQAP
jgi:hypothetical protein